MNQHKQDEFNQAVVALRKAMDARDYGDKPEDVALAYLQQEHRTNQQTLMRIVLVPFIRAFATYGETHYVDLRSEASVALAKSILEHVPEEDLGLPFI